MNRIASFVLAFIILLWVLPSKAQTNSIFHAYSGNAQGTRFKINYFSNAGDSISNILFDSIFSRLDSSLSVYKKNSLIQLFNKMPDTAICDEHLAFVVNRAKTISRITNGTFDITIGALTLPRKFPEYTDVNFAQLPQAECFGETLLQVNKTCVSKSSACVLIDVDGIAQGYTVDVLTNFLLGNNIYNFLVDVGGELKWKGLNIATGKPWNIAIEIPGVEPWSIDQNKFNLHSSEGALTTSGNYRKSLLDNSAPVSLYNANTHKAIKDTRLLVSVYSQEGILSDALDNAFMAMPLSRIKRFLRKNPQIACLLVYKEGIRQKLFISKNFPIYSKK